MRERETNGKTKWKEDTNKGDKVMTIWKNSRERRRQSERKKD